MEDDQCVICGDMIGEDNEDELCDDCLEELS